MPITARYWPRPSPAAPTSGSCSIACARKGASPCAQPSRRLDPQALGLPTSPVRLVQHNIAWMAAATIAVFLSGASQDVKAAQRIGESLRAAGIEVWFDHDGQRGGDAWDQQMRQQIHDCALFVPIISSHTDERSEGFF